MVERRVEQLDHEAADMKVEKKADEMVAMMAVRKVVQRGI